MAEFELVKKGYKPKQVDTFIQKLEFERDKVNAEQFDRILQLRKEVMDLEAALEEYKKRDKMVSNALVAAVAKAEEIEKVAKQKYEMELQSLKLFHVKWMSYYKQIIAKYPLDETLTKAAQFNTSLAKVLGDAGQEAQPAKAVKPPPKSDAEKQYETESRRLSAQNASRGVNIEAISEALNDDDSENRYSKVLKSFGKSFEPAGKIKSHFDSEPDRRAVNGKPVPPSESGFSIDEALNPEEDLEEILKSLGLDK